MTRKPHSRRVAACATFVGALIACALVIVGVQHVGPWPLALGSHRQAAERRAEQGATDVPLVSDASAASQQVSAEEEATADGNLALGGTGAASQPSSQALPSSLDAPEEDAPTFTIPEGMQYVDDVALVTVAPDADPAEVTQALAGLSNVVAHEVTAEEVATGTIEVGLVQGSTVEDAVNELLEADTAVDLMAQPDYIYYPAGWFTPEHFRALLASSFAETVAEPEPLVMASDDATAGTEASDAMRADDAAASDATPAEVPEDQAAEPEQPQDDEGQHEAAQTEAADAGAQGTEVDTDADRDATHDGEAQETAANSDGDASEDGAAPAGDAAEQEQADPTKSQTEQEAEDASKKTAEDLLEALAVVTINDPGASNQWALSDIYAYEAWGVAKCSGKVTVAVMDTGFDVNHADLKANLLPGRNIYESTSDISPFKGSSDYSHGTHAAGIISAVANNGVGVAGLSYNAKVLPLKVFFERNSSIITTSSTLVKAYTYVKNSGYNVRVVNLSLGGVYSDNLRKDTALLDAVNEAFEQGVVTVAAAGNSTLATPPFDEYPGDFKNIVSVINVTSDHVRSSTSNYNRTDEDLKNISAPGTSIYSTIPSNGHSSMSGTSMASPCVAAVLALEFAADPSLTASQAVAGARSTPPMPWPTLPR